jgi:3-phytase
MFREMRQQRTTEDYSWFRPNCHSTATRILLICCCLFSYPESGLGQQDSIFTPAVSLGTPTANDQDDCCVWVHPKDSTQSVIITSDKTAKQVFVYDLQGKLLQSIPVPKPGNIDIRQNILFGGESLDVVAVNQRTDGFALVIFKVIPESRTLERIDAGCSTDPNYGGCLFKSPKTGRLYFLCTSEEGAISQYHLTGNAERRITATKVRTLKTGKCEGAVADDESGILYVADETAGVWKFDAEPDVSSMGTLVAPVGVNGLKGDVEGLTICKLQDGRTCLLVSDQGNSRFAVYDCNASHDFLATFQIEGVGETDGIDVCTAQLGPDFPGGLFACHNGLSPSVVSLTSWASIEAALSPIPARK